VTLRSVAPAFVVPNLLVCFGELLELRDLVEALVVSLPSGNERFDLLLNLR
jgi:hypothetical protein